jgi:hypothetical protein
MAISGRYLREHHAIAQSILEEIEHRELRGSKRKHRYCDEGIPVVRSHSFHPSKLSLRWVRDFDGMAASRPFATSHHLCFCSSFRNCLGGEEILAFRFGLFLLRPAAFLCGRNSRPPFC